MLGKVRIIFLLRRDIILFLAKLPILYRLENIRKPGVFKEYKMRILARNELEG